MKAILLCGYRNLDENEPLLGHGHVDQRIRDLKALGCGDITVVLAGPRADEYLSNSKLMHNLELVFDTNDEVSLLTNLRAGLAANEGSCFVLPIEIEVPDASVWKQLWSEGRKAQYSEQTHILQLIEESGAPWQSGFPLFLTLAGRKFLQNTKDLKGFLDPRVTYLHQVYQQESDLAPEGIDL